MARINTNVASLIAQNNLARSNEELQTRLERLSTGLRINSGADDPAGLIISEQLRSEIQGIDQAIDNANRASNVIATGEAALSEVASLLNSIKSLTVEAANEGGVSDEEIEANQLQIDSAVESINRIADTTSFGGLKLLNGSLDYQTEGVATSAISSVRVQSAQFGDQSQVPVDIEVIENAQKGDLYFSNGSSTLGSDLSIEVAGSGGVQTFEFASGTQLSAVAFAINQSEDALGVTASVETVSGNDALKLESAEYGSDQFVSARKIPGTGGSFTTYDTRGDSTSETNRATGDDVMALINGNLALGDGTTVDVNTSQLKLEMDLTDAYATSDGTGNEAQSFNITGGGAKFQLGPDVNTAQQVGFGIQGVTASRLGNADIGFLNSITSGGDNALTAGNAAEASRIINKAIEQISTLRGRLGSFERNTLQTNSRALEIAKENLTASESRIRDADFAKEASKLSRAQILNQVGTNVLSQANSSAQNVLQLLQ